MQHFYFKNVKILNRHGTFYAFLIVIKSYGKIDVVEMFIIRLSVILWEIFFSPSFLI